MTLIEKLDTVLWMSGRSMMLGEIIGAVREMWAEHVDSEALRHALIQHPALIVEGVTYRIDLARRGNWLIERFGLSGGQS